MSGLVGDLGALYARHAPDDAVAFGPDGVLPWQTHQARARALAMTLPARDEARSEVVVVCEDRLTFASALLAAWLRGHAVALPPNAQPDTVRAIRARALTVLHDRPDMPGVDVRAVRTPRSEPVPLPLASVAAHAVTLYTSGSTGEHLACPKSAAQLLGEARVLVETFGLARGTRVLATVPPHHVYGLLFGVLVPAVAGGAFHAQPALFGEDLARSLEAQPVDVLVTVPAHLTALRALPAGRLPLISRVFSSGAPLPSDVAEDLRGRFGWTITEVFGSSETGGIAWRDRPGSAPWRPLSGVQISLGEAQRLAVDSPFLHPSMPRPYVTGDRVELVPGGFEHLGRADGVVKVGASRVSLVELEARVRAVPGVTDCAALAVEVPGPRGTELRLAYVGEVEPAAVRAALRGWLSPVTMPRLIRRVTELPRTAHGKLPRAALEALLARREKSEGL